MSARNWVVPETNPDKHWFLMSSEEDLHQPSGDCWCKPQLILDPEDETGKDWIWFHRVLH